jgi:MerR family transcriptional regulator, copper efflux regulator
MITSCMGFLLLTENPTLHVNVNMKSSSGDAETMPIGELAARFGLAPHVLRHWEAMGLLAPATRVNGRRRYAQEHLGRVAMIVGGKAGGLSLEQLGDLLAAGSPDDRRQLLERHHADLERRQRDIERSKAMIEHALDCDEHDFTQCPNFRRLVDDLADGAHIDATDHTVWGSRRPQEPPARTPR